MTIQNIDDPKWWKDKVIQWSPLKLTIHDCELLPPEQEECLWGGDQSKLCYIASATYFCSLGAK